MEYILEGKNIEKTYKHFKLDVPEIKIPKGFATALIGENGAGKTTLLEMMAGIRLNYKGDFRYFGQYTDQDRETNPLVREAIGYTGTSNYFMSSWKLGQLKEIEKVLFDQFDGDKFDKICQELAVNGNYNDSKNMSIGKLSDGNIVKVMLASVLARDTKLLLMDEPASPLDPLMREKLCELIRDYLLEKEGENTVVFSTHNIMDMENVTDYAIIVENGKIVEQGFVEELKEKYVYIKGEKKDENLAREFMYSFSANTYGYEGICHSDQLDRLAGLDVSVEMPSLSQICVAVMKHNSKLA